MDQPKTSRDFEYGVLLPHFGRYTSRDRLRGAGRLIEGLGFDSVWVRDHVVQQPHDHEDPDATFLDAFVVLATVAATTARLKLGTAVLIPHRHPILAAMMFSSLEFVAGPGRVVAGCGTGNWDAEFEAVGLGGWDRRVVIEEYVRVMKELWKGGAVDHEGDHYRFEGVEISPCPHRPIPVWYGGNSAAAARRAAEYCDGFVASRIPLPNFAKRMKRMRRIAGELGHAVPTAAVIPYVVPADTVAAGAARLSLTALLRDLNAREPPPEGGSFTSIEDLQGAAIPGPANEIVDWVRRFQAEGAQHFIFDLRPCLEDWEDRLVYLGEKVIPVLREEDCLGTPGPHAAAVRE